jgi:hypothetical protein
MVRKGSLLALFLSTLLAVAALGMNGQVQTAEAATTLGQLAGNMEPGTWAKLETNGLDELLDAPGSYTVRSLLEYADGGAWDRLEEKFYFIGGGHDAIKRFIVYSVETNTWTELPQPYWIPGNTMHGYDHTAINVEAGELYHSPYGDSESRYIYKYNIASGSWSRIEARPYNLDGYVACCTGIEYFPEMGGLILSDGSSGEIAFYDREKDEWTDLARGLPMGEYHNFAEYNPVHGVLIAGGGNGSPDIYRVDPDGTVTEMGTAPIDLWVSGTVTTTDPVSGDYLVLASGLTLYAYDVTKDEWRIADANPPMRPVYDSDAFDIIATPVPNYGVTMFVIQADWYDGEVWLYKHAASEQVEGDLNQDGVVDTQDVNLCADVILGREEKTAIRLRADVNQDDRVNVLDLQKILNIVAGG